MVRRYIRWMKFLLAASFLLLTYFSGFCQAEYDTTIVYPDGRVMQVRISDGDTIMRAWIPEVIVKAPPVFADDEEYRQYMRYRRYAASVLPYAIESIKLYNRYLKETEGLPRGKAKKVAKEIQNEAKEEFTDPLKNLSRTQGKILVKMIERHLDKPMFDVLYDIRGMWAATKWQTMGKLYGYDLKDGYTPGEDKMMDLVLKDFEIDVSK